MAFQQNLSGQGGPWGNTNNPNTKYQPYTAPQKTGPMQDDPSGGQYQEYSYGQNQGKAPNVSLPGQPNYGGVLEKQLKTAQNYRDNLGKTSDSIYDTYANAARGDLAQGTRKVSNSFAGRGLLGSGMQTAATSGVKSDVATGLAGKRSEINQGLLGNLNQLEGNAFNTASTMAGTQGPNTWAPALSMVQGNVAQQNQDEQAQNQLFSQLGGGIGQLAGTGLANSMYNNQNPMGGVTQQGPWAGGYGNGSMNQGYYK